MWDNIYHESLEFLVPFKYEGTLRKIGHKEVYYSQKKRTSLEVFPNFY